MKNEHNDIDKELFRKWQQESGQHSQQLNIQQMKTLLKNASNDLSVSLKRTIRGDMFFKSILMAGFLIIGVLYAGNLLVVASSLIFLLLGTVGVLTEKNLINKLKDIHTMEMDLAQIVGKELKFYRSNLLKYPVLLSISLAMFYVLGSMIYYALTYGYIKPFDDAVDVVVILGLMLIGVLGSLAVNFPFFRAKINNLEMLLNDMDNEENFRRRAEDLRTRKKLIQFMLLILAATGIIALILIITH